MSQSAPQPAPPPRLIHRLEFAAGTPTSDAERVLELVHVGDRGSLIDNGDGTYTNSTVKDGFDDFALLLDPPDANSGDAAVWVYDGRLGKRYRDPANPAIPLEYTIPAASVLGDMATWPIGICGAGGKNLVGDNTNGEYPDLVIGGPLSSKPGQSWMLGRIWILDMKDFDTDITQQSTYNKVMWNPVSAEDGMFGASLRLLGDFTGTGRSEILVGAPGGQNTDGANDIGKAYIVDPEVTSGGSTRPKDIQDVPAPFNAFPGHPCDTCDSYSRFGFSTAVIGDVADINPGTGADRWGEDAKPEIMVGDPMYSASYAPACCANPYSWERENGMFGWLNMGNVPGAPPRVVNNWASLQWWNQYYYYAEGTFSLVYMGYEMDGVGDTDLGVDHPQIGNTPSWDFSWAQGGTVWTGMTDVTPITGNPPCHGFNDGLVPTAAMFPHWALPLSPQNRHASQYCGVGDIDLDNHSNGYDDYAYVQWNLADAVYGASNTWLLRHEIHVADGRDKLSNPPSDLYLITRDPVTQRELIGTPTPFAWSTNGPARRTSVSRLGDVDGNGIDDFGVVSGYSTEDPYVDGEDPTHAVVLIYGSTKYPPVGSTSGSFPRINGNRVAQRGSRISLRVESCPPGAQVTLYEDTALSPAISECDGTRRVAGTSYVATADAQGTAWFTGATFDLDYYPASAPKATPGTWFYYQARVEGYQPPAFPCKLTGIWELMIVDSSNPLDVFRGES